ncbi:MAG: ABC transporter ATP-binding protein [Oscillospiraceae bacterium]|nr:ABC transporter ATP-binding protein [Oscillospiraceae bacterium]
MAILEMKKICKAFSGVYANKDINLTVEKGEIHALLGENGAGKTTLVNILFGIYTADSGEILWKGKPAGFSSPKEAIAAGIGMVHQHFSLVQKMTVLDNIILGMKENGLILNRAAVEKRIIDLAQKYGLTLNPRTLICNLSVGEQQRVEILKALYRNVELLILDEPTGVLTPQETAQFFDVLRSLKNEGYAIIIITHRMSEIMAISDRVTILRDGRQVANLVTSQTNPTELSRHMIGRELNECYDISKTAKREGGLLLEHVSLPRKLKGHPLHDVSLSVQKGEILGIAGVEGNGQKELAEVIAGIQQQSAGTISLDGADIGNQSVKTRYKAGIAYISDDRHNDSLIVDMNITENLMLRDYCNEPYSHHKVLNRKLMVCDSNQKMEKYQVKASGSSGINTTVKLMSGGNQQKLIIARELSDNAKVIVASQPTRGLDIGATEFVRGMLVEQRNAGKSVVLISADLEEIMALSDRIAVLFGGRIVGLLNRSEATIDRIGLLMGGVTGKESAL